MCAGKPAPKNVAIVLTELGDRLPLSPTGGQQNRRLAAAISAAYVVTVDGSVAWPWNKDGLGTGTSPGGGQAFVAATSADLRRHAWHPGDVRQCRRRVRGRGDRRPSDQRRDAIGMAESPGGCRGHAVRRHQRARLRFRLSHRRSRQLSVLLSPRLPSRAEPAPPGCREKTAPSCTISAPMPASSRPISRKCSPVGRRRSTLSSRCRRLSAKLAQSVERLGRRRPSTRLPRPSSIVPDRCASAIRKRIRCSPRSVREA